MALKVRAGRPSAEPYRRFKQEIETLERIGVFPGVLPVLESHIPDSPSKEDPAWLAMPIARPVRNVLADAELEQVIDAVAGVTDTLARLQEAHDLGHRDVKPPNLYELAGEWLIGDFGLIDIPEGDDLTGSGKPIGSRHYTPWEMISNPAAPTRTQPTCTRWARRSGSLPPARTTPQRGRSQRVCGACRLGITARIRTTWRSIAS